jgi:hypothetical protein
MEKNIRSGKMTETSVVKIGYGDTNRMLLSQEISEGSRNCGIQRGGL